MTACAQEPKYLITPVDLMKINFETFNVADFYSQAGNVIYKKPVSGLADNTAFGYLYGTNAEGLKDQAGTLGGVTYYAMSMVVNNNGKLVGVCASAAPASRETIANTLKALEHNYGNPEVNALKQQYIYKNGEKYIQLSLVAALDDYNKPIPNTFTTRLYILDKAYVQRIKEGINENEFAALNKPSGDD